MDPLVTIIVPVAEAHAGLLPRALRSLTNQSIQAHKVVVVNDTGKPLRCDDGAAVLNSKGHQGQSIARNLAIDRVDTPFLLFLDADDLAYSTMMETLIRAYILHDANYLYGDALQVGGPKEDYFVAPPYDRKLLFTRNLHNVTALLPTRSVKAIGGFDEKVKGWEDWEFYVRMAVNGFCGAKVPAPLIVYNINAGVSRERHRQFQNDIFTDIHAIYGPYIDGRKPLMGCCGSDDAGKAAAEALVRGLPPDVPVDGYVLMEFIGPQQGTVPFRVGNMIYRGANNATDKFVRVKAEHAARLEQLRVWRRLPASALRTERPDPPGERVQARRTVPTFDRETPKAVNQSVALITCASCGHIINFHLPTGCQAVGATDQPCGCTKFVQAPEIAEETEDAEHNEDGGRAPARARKSRRNARADSAAA